MPTAKRIKDYFTSRYGAATNILVRDQANPIGLRPWQEEDSEDMETWISSRQENPNSTLPQRICHNVNQAAAIAGVGPHTINAWISRDENPLPHIRDSRRIIIPHFMLISWLRQEALRTVASKQTHNNDPKYAKGATTQRLQAANKNAGVPDTRDAGKLITSTQE